MYSRIYLIYSLINTQDNILCFVLLLSTDVKRLLFQSIQLKKHHFFQIRLTHDPQIRYSKHFFYTLTYS